MKMRFVFNGLVQSTQLFSRRQPKIYTFFKHLVLALSNHSISILALISCIGPALSYWPSFCHCSLLDFNNNIRFSINMCIYYVSYKIWFFIIHYASLLRISVLCQALILVTMSRNESSRVRTIGTEQHIFDIVYNTVF